MQEPLYFYYSQVLQDSSQILAIQQSVAQLFSIFRYDLSENLSGYRLTVDYPEDFEVIESLITNLYSRKQSFVITMKDIITFLDIHPEIKGRNSGFLPNKGWQSSFAKDKKAGF